MLVKKQSVETKKAKKSLLKSKMLKNTSQLKSITGGAMTSQCHVTQFCRTDRC